MFFEIEHLNKDLNIVGDGEGIEQAREWYSLKLALFNHYDSIITNFKDLYLLWCDFDKEDFVIDQFKPWEMIEFIINRKYGEGKEYVIENHKETKNEMTNQFYNGFQERLKKLLNMSSRIEIPIEVRNYKKPKYISKEEYESDLIFYYRTLFN